MDNISPSISGKINYDNSHTICTFPPKNNQNNSIHDKIRETVFRCDKYTSKSSNTCELTGKKYNENDLVIKRIDGSKNICEHHCFGVIMYHPENEKYFLDANILYECYNTIIQKHSLQGQKIKFYRSNGDLYDGSINEEAPIIYSNEFDAFCIRIDFYDNQELYKTLPLNDDFSNVINKTVKGLYSSNEDFFKKLILEIEIKKEPEWLIRDRINWKIKIKKYLDKTKINYKFINK